MTIEDTPAAMSPAANVRASSYFPVAKFPTRLYNMLCHLEANGQSHIASFQPHGRCFRVHKPSAFVKVVLPDWFNQSSYNSFRRQLYAYGFKRITAGLDKDAYYHESFLSGQPALVDRIVRKNPTDGRSPRSRYEVQNPNFYIMTPLPRPPLLPFEEGIEVIAQAEARQEDLVCIEPTSIPQCRAAGAIADDGALVSRRPDYFPSITLLDTSIRGINDCRETVQSANADLYIATNAESVPDINCEESLPKPVPRNGNDPAASGPIFPFHGWFAKCRRNRLATSSSD